MMMCFSLANDVQAHPIGILKVDRVKMAEPIWLALKWLRLPLLKGNLLMSALGEAKGVN
jgi:hypothetical protein